MIKPHLHLIF